MDVVRCSLSQNRCQSPLEKWVHYKNNMTITVTLAVTVTMMVMVTIILTHIPPSITYGRTPPNKHVSVGRQQHNDIDNNVEIMLMHVPAMASD